ncbi:MAG: hypothetical protein AMXMBFR67_32900 [Nitrospira sp.]
MDDPTGRILHRPKSNPLLESADLGTNLPKQGGQGSRVRLDLSE